MNDQTKRDLVKSHRWTYDGGVPCSVAGWKNEDATVSPSTGNFYRISWDALQAIADGNHDILRGQCIYVSSAWLGCMCEVNAKLERALWRAEQERTNAQ